jgi:hypothetical protein
MINRRHDGRASGPAQHSSKHRASKKPRIHLPATWKGGHERWNGPNQNVSGESSSVRRRKGQYQNAKYVKPVPHARHRATDGEDEGSGKIKYIRKRRHESGFSFLVTSRVLDENAEITRAAPSDVAMLTGAGRQLWALS